MAQQSNDFGNDDSKAVALPKPKRRQVLRTPQAPAATPNVEQQEHHVCV